MNSSSKVAAAPTRTTATTIHVQWRGTDGGWLDLRETAHLTMGCDGAFVSFDRTRS